MVACPTLDWPIDLFLQNQNVPLPPLEKLKSEFLCTCGCQERHNCAVSKVVGVNGDPQVLWYRNYQVSQQARGSSRLNSGRNG